MIDRFVVDDLILISGGKEISVESFQNEDGNRGASGWRVVGRNNGILGGESGQREIAFTGTAVWAVREDGKLLCNWSSVRRSSPQGQWPGQLANPGRRPPPSLEPCDAPGMRLALPGVIVYSCRNGQVPI